MATLADTSDLLDRTIDTLTNGFPGNAEGASENLLQQWVSVLNQSENTQDLAAKLTELNEAITQSSPDATTIQRLMNDLADATQEFSAKVGPEGELPAELQGLAAAIREASDTLTPKS